MEKKELVQETLKVKLLSDKATIPSRAEAGSVGYDLFCVTDTIIHPLCRQLISTHIAVALPAGVYGRIAPRSGLAVKNGIDVFAGVVDPSYRGEVKVCVFNSDKEEACVIKSGERIAQLILEQIKIVPVVVVEDLDKTERGEKGFGSSGK